MDSSGLKEDIFYSSSWMQEILVYYQALGASFMAFGNKQK